MLGGDGTADRIGRWMAIVGFALSAAAVVAVLVPYPREGRNPSSAYDRPKHAVSLSNPR